MYFLLLFVMYCFIVRTYCDICDAARSCGECFSYPGAQCIWCSKQEFSSQRCAPLTILNTEPDWCDKSYESNIDVNLTTIENRNFSSTSPVVQLRPQKVAVKLRPGVPVQIKIQYSPAIDYPIDVYYIMDFSYTMEKHFEKLKTQGQKIYSTLRSSTNNVYLGFGSFIEKPALPYADPSNQVAYTFRNQLPLTDNTTYYEEQIGKLNRARDNSNLDDPEATLEALVQAMVCDHNVNWRNESRKIIVISTDNTYHSYGDGKIAGAFKPNDLKCHVDNINLQKVQDYPSVGQVKKVSLERKIKIIFAVLQEIKPTYESLKEKIIDSDVKELSTDTDIDELIKETYLKEIRSLKLDTPEHSNKITVAFDKDCTTGDVANKEECHFKHNEVFTISANITAITCLNSTEQVKFGVSGLKETLTVKVETTCECECEKIYNNYTKVQKCSNKGGIACGICKCDPKSYGEFCQCTEEDKLTVDKTRCKMYGNETYSCNGNGDCWCGRCQCKDSYSGLYCQYNEDQCPRNNGKICSGQGDCVEEKCVCKKEWYKSDCHCPRDTSTCIAPYSKEICSGLGTCDCGKCICNSPDYLGAYCDICEECTQKRCSDFYKIVECNFFHNQSICEVQFNETAEVRFVNRTEMNSGKWISTKACIMLLDDGSEIIFRYEYGPAPKKLLQLIIQREKNDPSKANIWIAIGATVGSILLIGLVTLIIWKILIDKYDAREYSKFEKEALSKGLVCENPEYKDPTVYFANPTFNSAN